MCTVKKYSQCVGEVFQIFGQRAEGHEIKVADRVGLFYPEEGKWFGCWQKHCDKRLCPGEPTYEYGFANSQKCKQCGGEIFTIYACGKNNGDVIMNKDAIMLLFGTHVWVSVWEGTANTDGCPGKTLLPPKRAYDRCPGEAFESFKV